MRNRLRLVIDTNVLVSASLFKNSSPDLVVRWAFQDGTVLLSSELLSEIQAVIDREKFDRYIERGDRVEFLRRFIERAEIVQVVDQVSLCRDPRDDMVLALALSGKATHIVSGDADLLALNPFRGVLILSPAAFLETVLT